MVYRYKVQAWASLSKWKDAQASGQLLGRYYLREHEAGQPVKVGDLISIDYENYDFNSDERKYPRKRYRVRQVSEDEKIIYVVWDPE